MSDYGSVAALLKADPEPPPEVCALVVAREFDPTLDLDRERARLDALAAPLAPRTSPYAPARAQALALADHVYATLGFRGDEADYYAPENSLLPRVLDRREGIPITLAVVLSALGARAGLNVEGVGFPGHFIVRLGGSGGLFLDPFFGGKVLERDDLLALWKRYRGDALPMDPDALEPIGARALTTRMLMNLKNSWERRGDHAQALLACDRLVDVTDAPEMVRDRGLHAFALRAFEAAAADLDAYLRRRPGAKDTARVERVLEAAKKHRGAGVAN
ncbi:MAG: transglutaminase-like domain-containing protein [Polyangiales bacterium]